MATELFLNRPADAAPTPDETGFNAEPSEYVEHFHSERNHQGKGNILLFPRDTDRGREWPVLCRERLGGLLHYYHREAA